MFRLRPVKKLSRQITKCPSARSRSQRWEPMKPAPPVTRIRMILVVLEGGGAVMPTRSPGSSGGSFCAREGRARMLHYAGVFSRSQGSGCLIPVQSRNEGVEGGAPVWPVQHSLSVPGVAPRPQGPVVGTAITVRGAPQADLPEEV